jgi:CheY-like chemotaxis protein/HPt (histidine-containing phosphotransfer) domain-containing protein
MLDRSRSAGRPFGLVLIDSGLPGDDALALCRTIRRSGSHGSTPVAVLVPANRPADVSRALEAGAAATILKPVKQSKLARGIMTAVLGADRTLASLPEGKSTTGPDDEPALPPLKLLLAEDNEVNQKFAVRLLEKAGHRVTLAANGREALAASTTEAFDAILMDVQMPVLDGFEATRQLREREYGSGRSTPIIAMTANAAEGDREKCLASGMDGYIAKPIRSALLWAELRRLLADQTTASGAVEHREPSATPEAGDGASFDAAELLVRNDGNLEFLREMTEILAEDSARLLTEIQTAISTRDFQQAARGAHTLKGMVGNFCAEPALAAANVLESAAHEQSAERLPDTLRAAESALSQLLTDLNRFLTSSDPRT